MTGSLLASELLRRPVRLNGELVGRAVDLVVDVGDMRVVGLELDDGERFLPLPAARIGDDEIAIASPLLLLGADGAAFYRERSAPLRKLRGLPVARGGRAQGRLVDVVVGEEGAVTAIVVEADHGRSRIPVAADVKVGRASASAA